MASVEDRVVRMVFDNASFEAKLQTTIASLGQLDKALKMDGAKKGLQAVSVEAGKSNKALRMDGAKESLQSISAEASRFSLGNIGASVEGASAKFTALATIGITALSNITSKAISAGAQIAKSLTVAPLKAGFEEYELNMNSIQTVLANTKDKGTNLQDVNKALDQLNTYADKTIYNFGQMTKNIGTFTSAGVDLDTSVQSIKGISNVAAISGSSADQASSAMYQLSQAVASGSVKLQDWNSVVNSGMGGEVFQKSLFETGKALGTLKDVPMEQTFKEWTDSGHSFRESLKDGWITSDVLTTTLQGFTGEMTTAQLKAKGFTDAQAANIIEMGKVGVEAATKVRTFSQLVDTTKEGIGSGWSASFRAVIGDFDQATVLFSGISKTISGIIGEGADARNALLQGWSIFGGRNLAIEGLVNSFKAVGDVLRPLKLAFREIFPRTTSLELINITKSFRDFTAKLRSSPKTIEHLRDVFKGFFSIVKVGWTIIKSFVGFIKDLIGVILNLAGGPAGGLLAFAAKIGDLATYFSFLVLNGGAIEGFFGMLLGWFKKGVGFVSEFAGALVDLASKIDFKIPQGVLDFFTMLGDKIANFFSSFSTTPIEKFGSALANIGKSIANFFSGFNADPLREVGSTVSDVGGKINIFGRVFERLEQIWNGLKAAAKGVALVIGGIAKVFYEAFKGIGKAISGAMSGGDFSHIFDALNVALAAGILLSLRKLVSAVKDFDPSGGLFDKLKELMGGLTDTLKSMQEKLKSEALMNIAKAMGLLTISAIALSMVDSKALAKGFTAMTVGFGQLVGTLKALDKFKGATGAKDFIALSVGMNVLALSMVSMSFAVARLGSMENDKLARGLVGVTVLLGVVTGASVLLTKHTSGLLSSALAIRTMAVALGVLAGVVKLFSMMSPEEIGQGLAAIAGSLLILVLAVRSVPKDVGKTGVQILLIAVALNVLAAAVKLFALMSFEEIGKGLLGIFGSLGLIVGALNLMPKDMEGKAAGLLLIAGALAVIAIAMKIIGTMNGGDIAAAILGIALALVVLTVGMNAMEEAIPGALALLVAAAGLRVLAEVIKIFAEIGWGDLLKGLGALAVAMAVLGIAGYLLEPAIPGLLGFGIALMALGAAIALIGVGILAFAKSFVLLSKTSDKGSKNFIKAMKSIGKAIPSILVGVAEGLLDMIDVFVKAAPKLVKAFIEILGMILDGITTLIPKAGTLISLLIHTLLGIIRAAVPEYLLLGIDIIMAFLEGIRDRIGDIVDIVADIITNFINALSENMQQIIDAGVNFLVKFLDGLGDNIEKISGAVGTLIVRFIGAIASFHQQIIDAGFDLLTKFMQGITDDIDRLIDVAGQCIVKFIFGIGKTVQAIIDAGFWVITQIVKGIFKDIDRLLHAGEDGVGKFIDGIDSLVQTIIDKGTWFITNLITGIFKAWFDIWSAGLWALMTFIQGILNNLVLLTVAAADMVIGFLNALAVVAEEKIPELEQAGYRLGAAVVKGVLKGLVPGDGSFSPAIIGAALAGPLGLGVGLAMRQLGVNSPAKVSIPLGAAIPAGVAKGIDDSTHMIGDSLSYMANSTVEAIARLVDNVVDELAMNPEFNPVITPVLDLTGVQTEAGKIGEYINTMPSLSPSLSYSKAREIAYGVNGQASQTPENAPGVPGSVQFNQTINAPEQLSVADIYKQTRNQITMAKEELRIP